VTYLVHPPGAAPAAPIGFEDFLTVDIRVGTIVAAEVYAEARKPSLKLQIDFGSGVGVRKSCAQIAANYAPDDLIGRQIAAVVNFPPRQVGKVMSEVLTLGFPDEAGLVVLAMPAGPVPNGARLF
jgi:tRNA-binding protein